MDYNYVEPANPGASDRNDGTQGRPFKTLARALSANNGKRTALILDEKIASTKWGNR